MPEGKSVVVVVHNPGGNSRVSEKNEMLQSFAGDDFSVYFCFYNGFCAGHDIIERPSYQTRHDDNPIHSLIEIETIIGNRRSNDFLFLIHVFILR
jgi:hypothetical protein